MLFGLDSNEEESVRPVDVIQRVLQRLRIAYVHRNERDETVALDHVGERLTELLVLGEERIVVDHVQQVLQIEHLAVVVHVELGRLVFLHQVEFGEQIDVRQFEV